MAGKVDATCYVERSKVREILIASEIDNESTRTVLEEVDALPIVTAGDFLARLAAKPDEDGVREALNDLKTHRDVWRGAILEKQTPFGSDDDGSYWDHELKVFDRTFAALSTTATPKP